MPNWLKATVVARKVWTEGLFTITIDAPGVKPFIPGQFLQLALFDGEHRINRPYSVASPFGDQLEFFIVVVEDGHLTPRLWKLGVGDELEVNDRAVGSFTLEKTPTAETLWLVSTGTGLAPYIAMLRTNTPWERYRRICVVHGVRHAADLAYTDELRQYESQYPDRFRLVQSLTREERAGILRGRIPALFESGELERTTGWTLQPDNSAVMLCGNPAMLDDMEHRLEQRGLKLHRRKSPGQIVLERYW